MATIYQRGFLTIDDEHTFNGSLSYKTNPQIGGYAEINDNRYPFVSNPPPIIDIVGAPEGYVDLGRRCGYIVEIEDGAYVTTDVSVTDSGVSVTYRYRLYYQDPTYGEPTYFIATDIGGNAPTIFNTSLPIFETLEQAQTYILTGSNYADAINYVPGEDTTKEYYIYNKYGDATASYSGLEFTGTIFERYEDFTVNGLACLYMPTPFEMSIRTSGDVIGSTFSSIGRGIEEVVTEGSLFYSSPFYDVWDGIKTGTFRVSQNFLQTNMLIFTSLDDIDDFFNGIPDAESKAENYDDIVNSGETSAVNKTGTPEEETTFSVPTHRDTFTSRYIMSSTQLRWLNENYINNEDEIENLINGIKLWGQAKPVEFIIDVTYYPFDLRSVCSTVERPEMYFGTYGIRFGSNLGYIKTCDGFKDMGTFTLRPTFNGWRDVEPYQRLFVYLPYVGTYPLDIKRYMGKTINVRYYFDLNTRSCCACLIADGKLMDFWNGQIGITQAISSTDFSNYANSQINTLLSTARNVAIGGATGGVGGAVVGGATGIGEMIMNQAQEPRVTNMGSSSSIINEFLPQYVYFIFEIAEINEPSNLLSLKGKPSNASGKISQFSGYLSVKEVDLNCSGATDGEKQEIISLLKNGIRI